MQSLCWTTRILSRALRSSFSTLVETHRAQQPHFISVVCGFPKDFLHTKYKLGKFGDDSWFLSSTAKADVIGKLSEKF
jgi:protein phosphatase PTC7